MSDPRSDAEARYDEAVFEAWYNATFATRTVDTRHMNDCEEAWRGALRASAPPAITIVERADGTHEFRGETPSWCIDCQAFRPFPHVCVAHD